MRSILKLVPVVGPLFLIFGCGQSDEANKVMETMKTYSLCPRTVDARQQLFRKVGLLANQQQARIIDRASEAQQGLSDIGSEVLNKTGGELILLTVEKAGQFRVSVTNLGLKEKIVLSVRWWGEPGKDPAIDDLIQDLGPFWTIEEVDGGVTNDPPC
jgi:hypothetical protein